MKARTHRTLHRIVIALYPVRFRDEFGGEMSNDFEERISAKHSFRNTLGAWWNELTQLPESLATAYAGEDRSSRGQRLRVLGLIAAGAMVVAGVASHLVAHSGLYHRVSQLGLVAALLATGVLFGLVRVTQAAPKLLVPAALAITFFLFAPWAIDRHLVVNHTTTPFSADLPGVRLDVSKFSSADDAASFAGALDAEKAPRLRSETTRQGASLIVTVLRSGGVDGIYAIVALALVLMPYGFVRWRASDALFSSS